MPMHDAFKVHMLSEQGLQAANQIAEEFSALMLKIEELVPPGRERSLAATKLQEASYWAKRAIAVQPGNT